eukprot:7380489-Prymnesium_polylepis.1
MSMRSGDQQPHAQHENELVEPRGVGHYLSARAIHLRLAARPQDRPRLVGGVAALHGRWQVCGDVGRAAGLGELDDEPVPLRATVSRARARSHARARPVSQRGRSADWAVGRRRTPSTPPMHALGPHDRTKTGPPAATEGARPQPRLRGSSRPVFSRAPVDEQGARVQLEHEGRHHGRDDVVLAHAAQVGLLLAGAAGRLVHVVLEEHKAPARRVRRPLAQVCGVLTGQQDGAQCRLLLAQTVRCAAAREAISRGSRALLSGEQGRTWESRAWTSVGWRCHGERRPLALPPCMQLWQQQNWLEGSGRAIISAGPAAQTRASWSTTARCVSCTERHVRRKRRASGLVVALVGATQRHAQQRLGRPPVADHERRAARRCPAVGSRGLAAPARPAPAGCCCAATNVRWTLRSIRRRSFAPGRRKKLDASAYACVAGRRGRRHAGGVRAAAERGLLRTQSTTTAPQHTLAEPRGV